MVVGKITLMVIGLTGFLSNLIHKISINLLELELSSLTDRLFKDEKLF